MNFFQGIGLPEILIVAALILILFGGTKLKELARGLGESTKELKNVKKEFNKVSLSDDSDEDSKKDKKD
jgi:sec-independent protein translocase protein TatA